jgi:hypothetical protein
VERRNAIAKCQFYHNIKDVINLTRDHKSLFVFKPTKIINCFVKADYQTNFSKKYEIIAQSSQSNLIEKIPYKIYYTFLDSAGNTSTMQIIDWEVCQLIRKLIIKYKDHHTPRHREAIH